MRKEQKAGKNNGVAEGLAVCRNRGLWLPYRHIYDNSRFGGVQEIHALKSATTFYPIAFDVFLPPSWSVPPVLVLTRRIIQFARI